MNRINATDIQHDSGGMPRQVRGTYALSESAGDSNDLSDRITQFLGDNADQLGLNPSNLGLEVFDTVETPTVTSTRLRQVHDGVPVYGTEILVVTDPADQVQKVLLTQARGDAVPQGDADAKPMTPRRALTAAKKAIGATPWKEPGTPTLVYLPRDGGLIAAYRVVIAVVEPEAHEWEILVDAHTGDELQRTDLLFHVDGQGLVFDPNPVVTANNNTLRDPAAAGTCGFAGTPIATIDAQRVTRTLRDLTLSGGVHHLDGPFVRIADFSAPNIAPPTEANANDFTYPSDSAEFDAVNVYYHVDTVQRYLQGLGILTAHPNVIEADVRNAASSGAFYSPSSDNLNFGNSGSCRPERASDGEVALHEYGHAIHSSQVPGWGVVSPVTGRRETRAMGEGFGDILACVFFAEHGGGFQREVFEDWIFGDVGGLRRVDGSKVYPADWVEQEHSDGEIWSAALWNIYRAIGGDSVVQADRLQARDELLKTLVLSHHRLAANSTMPDGAEAFLDENAAQPDFRLVEGVAMLDSFHDRGLLDCSPTTDLRITTLWSQQNELPAGGWQQVEAGQDNWFYAEVTNHGAVAARAFVVEFSFKSPFASPVYPTDFRDNIISGAVGYDLAPGATATVKARWPAGQIPPIPAGATSRHGCILAEVYTPEDHVAAGVTTIGASNGKLRQRNTDIVDLIPGDTMTYLIDLGNIALAKPELLRFEVIRDPRFPATQLTFSHSNPRLLKALLEGVKEKVGGEEIGGGLIQPVLPPGGKPRFTTPVVRVLDPVRVRIDAGAGLARAGVGGVGLLLDLAAGSAVLSPEQDGAQDEAVDDAFLASDADLETSDAGTKLTMRSGVKVGFPYLVRQRQRAVVKFSVTAPKDAQPGDHVTTTMIQRTARGEVMGEWDITVRIVKPR